MQEALAYMLPPVYICTYKEVYICIYKEEELAVSALTALTHAAMS